MRTPIAHVIAHAIALTPIGTPHATAHLARDRLFCASLGLSSETSRWPDVKVDFLMWLVARAFTLHATEEGDGGAPHLKKVASIAGGDPAANDVGNPADILHLRENLSKTAVRTAPPLLPLWVMYPHPLSHGGYPPTPSLQGLHLPTHYDVEKSAVRRLAERAVREEGARARLLERLEAEVPTAEVVKIGGAKCTCWEAGGLLGVFMDEWRRSRDKAPTRWCYSRPRRPASEGLGLLSALARRHIPAASRVLPQLEVAKSRASRRVGPPPHFTGSAATTRCATASSGGSTTSSTSSTPTATACCRTASSRSSSARSRRRC